MSLPAAIPGLSPAAHARHALHDAARHWTETNCYVDLLIEALAAKGFDPLAMFGFTVRQDYEGDQFTFFKPPAADLDRLYGVEVQELAIFDRLDRHLAEQIARGRLPMVEVDAYFLPDTAGLNYHCTPGKTTIGVNRIDSEARRAEYFHNAGYFMLDGADYDGLFAPRTGHLPLFPYAEMLKFDRAPAADPVAEARALLAGHLARRSQKNPLRAWREDFSRHAADLAGRPADWFHTYAFNTLRQVGANFELLASHLGWLSQAGTPGLLAGQALAATLAETAKAAQFKLARAMARKSFDAMPDQIEAMAALHDGLMDALKKAPLAGAAPALSAAA